MKKLFLIAAATIALCTPVQAKSVRGYELMDFCASNNGNNLSFCRGYLIGALDASKERDCSTGVKAEEIRGVVVAYLRANPKRWSASGRDLVIEAANAAWPCNKSQVAAPSPDEPPGDPSESDVAAAFSAAFVTAYASCGGTITAEQAFTVAEIYAKHRELVGWISKQIKAKSCAEIVSSYRNVTGR